MCAAQFHKRRPTMARILIPIDGSETALRAVRWVIEQIRAGANHQVSLLNVQPEILSGHARAYFTKTDLDAFIKKETKAFLENIPKEWEEYWMRAFAGRLKAFLDEIDNAEGDGA